MQDARQTTERVATATDGRGPRRAATRPGGAPGEVRGTFLRGSSRLISLTRAEVKTPDLRSVGDIALNLSLSRSKRK